jgi:hypothetical protein
MTSEITFDVHTSDDGGYTACALGCSIFTEASTWDELKEMARDAVRCHFNDSAERPTAIRLHFVRDEVFAV